ncbi:MAG: serine protease [Acidobacteriota bacterium]|nr:MAG: serine protease [Acidobacteriota bacterium]
MGRQVDNRLARETEQRESRFRIQVQHFSLAALMLAAMTISARAQEAAPTGSVGLIDRISPSVVMILVGKGGGRLEATGSGLVVDRDGSILTAWHLIRDAREVQGRSGPLARSPGRNLHRSRNRHEDRHMQPGISQTSFRLRTS